MMAQNYGPWTIQSSTAKYQNSFIQVVEDGVIQPDGNPGSYSTVSLKSGVAILPVDDEGMLYLTRQFRYAIGQESLEVVCGAIEADEAPLISAQREIQEELGIQATQWIDLGKIDLDTSIVRCPVYLFLAQNLTLNESHPEGTESIERIKLSGDRLLQMVLKSEITHAPSCVLILKYFLDEF